MTTDDSLFGELPEDLRPNAVGAVVFDLGNVLIRWDPHRAIAHTVGDDRAAALLADARFDFHAWNMAQDAGRSWQEGIAEAERRFPHHGEAARAYRDNFALAVSEPISETVDILRELHAAGVPLFALTNWSHELFPVARAQHDFLDLFDDIVVSGEEGVAKPDPEIYEILEERVRHITGLDDCVFIDDSAANVLAAEQAGIDAIHFTGAGNLRAELAVRGLPVRGFAAAVTEGDA